MNLPLAGFWFGGLEGADHVNGSGRAGTWQPPVATSGVCAKTTAVPRRPGWWVCANR